MKSPSRSKPNSGKPPTPPAANKAAESQAEQVRLEDLIDLDVLQRLQDGFAAMTGMSVMLCRRDGKILTRPSFGNRICRLMFERERGKHRRCLVSAVDKARQVASNDSDHRSQCFVGVDQYAAPIVVDGHRLATIVVCGNPNSCETDPSKARMAKLAGVGRAELDRLLDHTVKMDGRQLEAAIRFLHSLATALAQSSHREYELKRRVRELGMVHAVASMFAGRADLNEILQITAAQVVALMNVRACSIRTYNNDTRELQIRAVANLSKEYLHKGPVRLELSQIDQAALKGEPVQIISMARDPRVIYKREARREGLASGLAVGMIYRGQAVGVIHVYTATRHRFDRFEIEALKAIASQAASAVINAELHMEAHRAEMMDRQMKLAGEVQRRMLPQSAPRVPNLAIGMIYEPTYEIGGDFYDFIRMADGRTAVAIADIAGKGMPASLQMASLRSALRVHCSSGRTAREIIEETNRVFVRDTLTGEFATVFFGVIDPQTGVLEYLDAGHNPPFLVRRGRIEPLQVTGPVVGIFENAKFESRQIRLREGDALVLYTDGIIEAMNFDHEQFGLDRFRRSIRKFAKLRVQAMAENILWDVRRFVGLAPQSDDTTLVVVRYRGGQA